MPDCRRSVVVQGVYEELAGDERRYAEQRLGPARTAPRKDSGLSVSDTPAPLKDED